MRCYDSDADEEYLPNDLTSSDTDGDEQTPVAGLRKASKCKVRIEKNAAKPIQNQNSDSTNENGIHLRSEESLGASDNSDSNNIDVKRWLSCKKSLNSSPENLQFCDLVPFLSQVQSFKCVWKS